MNYPIYEIATGREEGGSPQPSVEEARWRASVEEAWLGPATRPGAVEEALPTTTAGHKTGGGLRGSPGGAAAGPIEGAARGPGARAARAAATRLASREQREAARRAGRRRRRRVGSREEQRERQTEGWDILDYRGRRRDLWRRARRHGPRRRVFFLAT
jgi:hypothetical protein